MIKTTAMIMEEQKNYASPADKLARMVKAGEYISIIKGLYETDKSTPGYLLAESIYGPSYLSFEFALSFHGLIPEAVYSYTSATFEKKKKKKYVTTFGTYTYRDVPSRAYPYGVDIRKDQNQFYKIASAEKALCDQLYKTKSVGNYKQLQDLLFDDLRIDETIFAELNADNIRKLALLYGSTNVKKLSLMMRKK